MVATATQSSMIEDGFALVENGDLWLVSKYEEKVSVNDWIEFLFRPSPPQNLAIIMRGISEGAAVMELYAAPDVSDTGPEFTVVNRNQIGSFTLSAKVYDQPVLGGGGPGTLLYSWSQGNRQGGGTQDTAVWGLDADTDYLVRLINTSGAKRDMTLHVDFLEGEI